MRKNICKSFNYQWTDIQTATGEQLIQINGIGDVMANAYVSYFQDEKNQVIIRDLLREIEFEAQTSSGTAGDMIFDGLVFVITGSVEHFKNRNELKDIIEAKGGKVTDSVTSKTDYLINNDNLSNSTKNKKAKELSVPIITEQQIVDWIENMVRLD